MYEISAIKTFDDIPIDEKLISDINHPTDFIDYAHAFFKNYKDGDTLKYFFNNSSMSNHSQVTDFLLSCSTINMRNREFVIGRHLRLPVMPENFYKNGLLRPSPDFIRLHDISPKEVGLSDDDVDEHLRMMAPLVTDTDRSALTMLTYCIQDGNVVWDFEKKTFSIQGFYPSFLKHQINTLDELFRTIDSEKDLGISISPIIPCVNDDGQEFLISDKSCVITRGKAIQLTNIRPISHDMDVYENGVPQFSYNWSFDTVRVSDTACYAKADEYRQSR